MFFNPISILFDGGCTNPRRRRRPAHRRRRVCRSPSSSSPEEEGLPVAARVADSCPAQHPSPALLRYAAAHVQGFPAPAPALALTQFGHGQSNPTYCLRAASATETRRYVLRKKPAGAILQSAHAVEREFQITSRRWHRCPCVQQRGNLVVMLFLLMISGYQDTLIPGKLYWKLALTVDCLDTMRSSARREAVASLKITGGITGKDMLDQRRLVDAGVAKIQVAYLVLAMMGAVYCSCMILSRERSSQLQKQGAGGGLAARGRVQETSGRWAVRQGEHGRWARTCVRSLGSSGARSPGSSSARSPGSSGDGSSGAQSPGSSGVWAPRSPGSSGVRAPRSPGSSGARSPGSSSARSPDARNRTGGPDCKSF